jgi:hypothetical protein
VWTVTATGIWETEQNANGLLDLFETVPANEYCGTGVLTCLIGYPVYEGVLANEPHDDMDDTSYEFLADRYNVPVEKLADIFHKTGIYGTRISRHKGWAMRYAKKVLGVL